LLEIASKPCRHDHNRVSFPVMQHVHTVTLAQFNEFDEVIDVRSPAEYEADHIPGAINLPVLDNDQRARVGTVYKQVSPFEAKKIGAALVSDNIARHLESHFSDKSRAYRPLVYCWRGGGRSGALAHVLHKIGWKVGQLEGGYKAYRKTVLSELETLPASLRFAVIRGPTGCGKSRLLQALRDEGAQVLDLEDLAAHRGSVLGNLPDRPQPSQKMFESEIWFRLRCFRRDKTIFVESESKKIGVLHVPETLLARMRGSPCIGLDAPIDLRARLLLAEYAHFLNDRDLLYAQIDCLIPLLGEKRIAGWKTLVSTGHWDAFVREILLDHYDPAYRRAIGRNYPERTGEPAYTLRGIADSDFTVLAREISQG
jgi:tRNA 2-selenouridine synthase